MNANDIVIDVHGLTKKFDGRAVVRNLSMQVKRGTIYGFLGPNGSGKTTTIRMLCGLLTPDEGTGTCLGYDIRTETDKIKRQVGYMTQHFQPVSGSVGARKSGVHRTESTASIGLSLPPAQLLSGLVLPGGKGR